MQRCILDLGKGLGRDRELSCMLVDCVGWTGKGKSIVESLLLESLKINQAAEKLDQYQYFRDGNVSK